MSHRFLFLAVALCASAPLASSVFAAPADSVRTTQSFDADWLFSRSDAAASEDPMFDDVNWRTVRVPHDWAIEGGVAQDAPSGRGGGYRATGVSWYRKRFSLPATDAGRRIFVEFDGVMGNSAVWINGQKIGGRPSGYIGFACELTGRVKLGDEETNVLAVRTDTSRQPASRWYAGQGIYRHVRLVVTDPVRIAPHGITVTTPEIKSDHAVIHVRTSVTNYSPQPQRVTVRVALTDPTGSPAGSIELPAHQVGIGETSDFAGDVDVAHPQFWDIAQGKLYRAAVSIAAHGKTLDDDTAVFGIRDARFEAATGFWLNGRNVPLKGVALHQDGGAVGDAVPLAIWERRLALLRTLGVNAIRTAHNPPAPEFLDLCDRMGFLVMDELFDAWTVGKPGAGQGTNVYFTEWGHRDARDTVRRDRNHPGIILFSVGNEIHDTAKPALAKNILAGLVGIVHAEDPTRPATQALFRPNTTHDYTNGLADMLDVIGTNYRDRELLAAQRAKPSRKIVGTEERHDRETWLEMRDHPSLAGQFLWAGIDYLGEGDWPDLSSGAGLLDRTGRLTPRAFERQSWWGDQPMVHLARHEPALAGSDARQRPGFDLSSDWTPKNAATYHDANVEVFSNCDTVELTLNGQSLGSQAKPADASPRVWKIPFAAGTLEATARNGNEVVATHTLRTAGAPARLVIATDRAKIANDWDDVAVATVTVVDANGVPCPWADNLIAFKISGPGAIMAVDNGDRRDPAPYQATERKLFRGEGIALVNATADSGDIIVTASTPGLPDVAVTLAATPKPAL